MFSDVISEEKTLLAMIMGAGAAVLMAQSSMKKETKQRCFWRTELYKKRTGGELRLDMKSQCVTGHYKNFDRISPTHFEHLLCKIGPKISKQETHLLSPILAQDRFVNLYIFIIIYYLYILY